MTRNSIQKRMMHALICKAAAALLAVLSLSGPASVRAQMNAERGKQPCNDSIFRLVGRHFDLENFPPEAPDSKPKEGGSIISSACKVWPRDKTKTIAAFAYDEGVDHEKKLFIALVDRGKKIAAAFEGKIGEDAVLTIGEKSLSIDTARYDFATGMHGFGLDLTTTYTQGCLDGGVGPTRTLYIFDGQTIRPILEDFYISDWRFLQGGYTCMGPDKDPVTEDFWYSIGVGRRESKGLPNLVITARSSNRSKRPFRYELPYDGQRYLNNPNPLLERWRGPAK